MDYYIFYPHIITSEFCHVGTYNKDIGIYHRLSKATVDESWNKHFRNSSL